MNRAAIFYFLNQYNRIINYLFKLFNMIKFLIYGIKIGKKFTIHGHIGLKINKSSKVIIGDNFYFSSGRNNNPLSRNLEGRICVNEDAEIVIGSNVGMSSVVIWSHKSITIGNNVLLGANVTLLDSDCHSKNYMDRRELKSDIKYKIDGSIKIENDVLIGMNTIVLKGVTIGARSIIGAGSVVVKSIPPDSIAAGNPCKVIKKNL